MNLTGNIIPHLADRGFFAAILGPVEVLATSIVIAGLYGLLVFLDRKQKAGMTLAERYRTRDSLINFLMPMLFLALVLLAAIKLGFLAVKGVPQLIELSFVSMVGLAFVVVLELCRMEFELKPQWRLFCPHCGKFTPYKEKWHCGYCDHLNGKASVYESCAVCGKEPGSYKCNHCKKLILFSVEKPDEQHFARHYREPVKPVPLANEPSIRQKRSDEEDEIKHKILVAKMNTELATVEKQFKSLRKEVDDLESSRSSSHREKIEHQLKQDMERGMAMLNLVESERKRIRKEFENDEELMERHLAWLEQWYAENMG